MNLENLVRKAARIASPPSDMVAARLALMRALAENGELSREDAKALCPGKWAMTLGRRGLYVWIRPVPDNGGPATGMCITTAGRQWVAECDTGP